MVDSLRCARGVVRRPASTHRPLGYGSSTARTLPSPSPGGRWTETALRSRGDGSAASSCPSSCVSLPAAEGPAPGAEAADAVVSALEALPTVSRVGVNVSTRNDTLVPGGPDAATNAVFCTRLKKSFLRS